VVFCTKKNLATLIISDHDPTIMSCTGSAAYFVVKPSTIKEAGRGTFNNADVTLQIGYLF
jgi:hypothetical protein